MSAETHWVVEWRIDHRDPTRIFGLTLVAATTDPETIALVEAAAARAGIWLYRKTEPTPAHLAELEIYAERAGFELVPREGT